MTTTGPCEMSSLNSKFFSPGSKYKHKPSSPLQIPHCICPELIFDNLDKVFISHGCNSTYVYLLFQPIPLNQLMNPLFLFDFYDPWVSGFIPQFHTLHHTPQFNNSGSRGKNNFSKRRKYIVELCTHTHIHWTVFIGIFRHIISHLKLNSVMGPVPWG